MIVHFIWCGIPSTAARHGTKGGWHDEACEEAVIWWRTLWAGRVLAIIVSVVLATALVPTHGLAETVVELTEFPAAAQVDKAVDKTEIANAAREAEKAPKAAEGSIALVEEEELTPLEAQDEDPVTYFKATLEGSTVTYTENQVPSGYTLVAPTDDESTWGSGWYVVDSTITISGSINAENNSEINIVLKNGCVLMCRMALNVLLAAR